VSLATAAVVVSHNRPDLLAQCLRGLGEQTLKPNQVVVVETSESAECAQLALDFGAALVQPGAIRLGAAIEAGRLALAQPPGWLWVLHDDAAAEPWALERLLKTAEVSPSVAIVGGKLLDASRPGVIQQLGLSATRTGSPFLLIQDEFDQGQHDSVSDSLAVSTAGMLISNRAWQELGGLRDDVPIFASDVDLGVRARVSGYRVIVEPAARILHHGLSMSGGRSRSWLGSARWYALRRAQLHLGFTITKLPLAILLAVLAPAIGVLRAVGQIVQKRPQRMFGELVAPVEFLLTLPRAIAARQRISGLGSRSNLSGLFATLTQQRARRQARLRHLPAGVPGVESRGLVASGSWWFGLFALTLNLEMIPRAEAIISAPLKPLGENLQAVFSATATEAVSLVGGQSVPSDSFNWALTALALTSPTNPSLALGIFVFAAGALAFWGGWQLMSVATEKIWLRNLLALGYALNPLLLGASRELMVVDLVALTALPWVIYLSLRVALAATPARAWRWLGLAGLAYAVLAVSSVAAAALVAVLVLTLMAVRWRRALILIWIPVAGAALLLPGLLFALQTRPELALRTSWLPALELPNPSWQWLLALPLVFFAGLALTSSRWLLALGLWSAVALGVFSAWLLPGAAALLGAVWLALSALAAVAVTEFRRQLLAAPLAAVLLLGPLLALADRPAVEWSEARVAPALVTASSAAGENYRTLVLNRAARVAEGPLEISVELRFADAGRLESRSLFVDALAPEDALTPIAAELSARLVAGNESGLSDLLARGGVGFVLLAAPDEDIATNLDSLPQLAAAGETRWGKLYRVTDPVEYQVSPSQSPVKLAQLALLAGYLLLAVPTAAAIRGSYRRRR
jgi:GT2 family glycosyltransferase